MDIGQWTTTPTRTEQHLVVHIGESEAEITNNRRLHSMYCAIEDTDRHEASHGLSVTAESVLSLLLLSNHRSVEL